MQHRRLVTLLASFAMVLAACSGGSADDPSGDPAGDPSTDSTQATTTTSPFSTTTTSTTVPARYAQLLAEPPPFEDVTLTTEDGVDLYAKYWKGGPVAVLAGHDFFTSSDEADGFNPRSSDTILWWTGVLAEAGYTVLSPDYRGHGASPENVSVRNSPVDLKAGYGFLKDEGYETIVMAGVVGSGTAAIVLDAGDADVEFDGIALIWSAPQEVGLDASVVLDRIEAPIYLVSFETPRLERWHKLMADDIQDLYDLVIYTPPPTGLNFVDHHGEEFAGRLLDFVDYIAEA